MPSHITATPTIPLKRYESLQEAWCGSDMGYSVRSGNSIYVTTGTHDIPYPGNYVFNVITELGEGAPSTGGTWVDGSRASKSEAHEQDDSTERGTEEPAMIQRCLEFRKAERRCMSRNMEYLFMDLFRLAWCDRSGQEESDYSVCMDQMLPAGGGVVIHYERTNDVAGIRGYDKGAWVLQYSSASFTSKKHLWAKVYPPSIDRKSAEDYIFQYDE